MFVLIKIGNQIDQISVVKNQILVVKNQISVVKTVFSGDTGMRASTAAVWGDSSGGVVGAGKTHWGVGGKLGLCFSFFVCWAAVTAMLCSVFCTHSVVVVARSVAIIKIST